MVQSTSRVRSALKAISVLALVSALSAPAFAQEAAEEEEEGSGDIVVTAQKREQLLSDVPAAIQAISGDVLERRGTRDLNQLVEFIPGASVVSKAAPGFETIQIRGISSGTVGDATVGYYIDDIIFNVPNLQLAPPSRLLDLERTEILRGPQGTLYGNGAMGGLIRLVTTSPDTNEFDIKAQGELSFTDGGGTNYAGDAAVNVPLASDVAGLRISGGYERLSGFADSATENNLNDVRSWNIRGKLLVRPADNVDVTLGIWHIDNHQDYSNNLLSVDPPRVQNPFGVTNPLIETVATFYSGAIKWDLGGVSLETGTSYIDHRLTIDSVVESTFPVAPGVALPIGIRNASNFDTSSFSQEIRLVSNADGPFNWIVGGLYTNATITSDIDVNIRGLGPVIPFLNVVDAPLKTESYAIFGEVSYELLDGRLIPLIGLRYFNDDRSASGATTFGGVTTLDDESGSFDALSPRFNLTFTPNDDTLFYANIARGFRSGTIQTGAQAQLAQATPVDTDVIIDEDSLWSYEIGTKLTFDRFFIDASLYYTDWSDIQIPFNTPFGLPAVVNGGDAQIYGIDLGFNWRTPLPGLTLQAVANFNSAEFKNVNPQLAAALATAQNGERLPGVPKNNYSFGATYSTALTESVDLNLYGAYSFRNRQSDLASGLLGGRLSNLTLRAGLETDQFRLDVFADNLTNERGPVLATPTAMQAVYPRRIGLSLTFKYR
jgi:iron complex outermembrane recepter protein